MLPYRIISIQRWLFWFDLMLCYRTISKIDECIRTKSSFSKRTDENDNNCRIECIENIEAICINDTTAFITISRKIFDYMVYLAEYSIEIEPYSEWIMLSCLLFASILIIVHSICWIWNMSVPDAWPFSVSETTFVPTWIREQEIWPKIYMFANSIESEIEIK